MSKKQKKTEKKNHALRNWIYTIVIILVIVLSYKCILISICNRKGDIDTYLQNRKVTDYASDIEITSTEITNKISFVDMTIENNFKELTPKSTIDEYPTKTYVNDNDEIVVSFHKAPLEIEDLDFEGVEKYLEASNIKDDEDINDFVIYYKRTSMDIFDSFTAIRNEMFKRNLYLLVYRSYDEIHHVTGDLNGRVLVCGDTIIYELYNGNDMYQVSFFNYDLDSTISIVSSIHFNEA